MGLPKILPALAVALAACVAAGMLSGLGWPFELFASLLPQFAFLALLLAGAGWFLHQRREMLLLLPAVAFLAVWGAREQFLPAGAQVRNPDLRIIWANMGNERDMRSFARLMALARSEGADMVLASEFPAYLSAEDVRRESRDFPHILGKPAGARTNIAVFSRVPVEEVGGVSERWNSGFLLEIPATPTPLTIAAAHTPTPMLPRNMARRDEIVHDIAAALSARIAADAAAALLVGDFNAVSWSALLRSVAQQGGKRLSYGWRASWRSSWVLLGLPIDHAFAFGAMQASARVGADIGSDHFPLLVNVKMHQRAETSPRATSRAK